MSDETDHSLARSIRRPYVPPRLTRFGTIAELTAALSSGASDGMTGTVAICSTLPC